MSIGRAPAAMMATLVPWGPISAMADIAEAACAWCMYSWSGFSKAVSKLTRPAATMSWRNLDE